MSPDGVISGVPTTAGAFTFRVTVSDVSGASASAVFLLAVTDMVAVINAAAAAIGVAVADQNRLVTQLGVDVTAIRAALAGVPVSPALAAAVDSLALTEDRLAGSRVTWPS